jgi:hypothetical protein
MCTSAIHKGLRLQQVERGNQWRVRIYDGVDGDRCWCLPILGHLFFSLLWCGGDGADLVAVAMEVVERQGTAAAARMSDDLSLAWLPTPL